MPELVVIAEQLLAPVPGGTGRYTAELLRALAKTAPPGWEVTSVVSRRPDVEKAQVEGVAGPRRLALSPRALVAAWRSWRLPLAVPLLLLGIAVLGRAVSLVADGAPGTAYPPMIVELVMIAVAAFGWRHLEPEVRP